MGEFDNLSEQEIELIKAFRKNNSELKLESTIDEDVSCRDWTSMKFKIINDIIHISTSEGRFDKIRGFNSSSSGFYHRDLTKDEVRQIQQYFDYFLSE